MMLARAGWSVEYLADRINESAAQLRLRVTVHRRHARRWVAPDNGRHRPSCPRVPIPGLACEVLSLRLGEPVTPAMLGWPNADAYLDRRYARADDGLSQSWGAQGALDSMAHVVDPGPVERRQFFALTGVSLTSVAHQWLYEPERVAASLIGDRVTDTVVNDLERVADGLRRVDDAIGGGTLLPLVRENLRLVVAMLANASYTEKVGKRLHALIAEFGRMAGWVAYDGGDEALAQRYWIAALRNAHVSDNRAVGANILAFMSISAAHSVKPQDAVDLARSALRVESALTPAVAASLHIRLAKGAAAAGDAPTAKRAGDRAVELHRQSDPEQEPDWIYWFDQAELEASIGQTALRLGQFTDAESHLRAAIARFAPGSSRERALFQCDLAKARLGIGSLEYACATASEAAVAIRRLNSQRDLGRLAEFRQALHPHATATAVRDFDDKHGDLLTAHTRPQARHVISTV
jgi:hypothetical protein